MSLASWCHYGNRRFWLFVEIRSDPDKFLPLHNCLPLWALSWALLSIAHRWVHNILLLISTVIDKSCMLRCAIFCFVSATSDVLCFQVTSWILWHPWRCQYQKCHLSAFTAGFQKLCGPDQYYIVCLALDSTKVLKCMCLLWIKSFSSRPSRIVTGRFHIKPNLLQNLLCLQCALLHVCNV